MDKGVIVYAIDTAREFGVSVWSKSGIPNLRRLSYPDKGRRNIRWANGHTSCSTVFDVADLNFAERIEFTNKFCQAVMDKRKNSRHNPDTFIFFEEAHLYFPQGSMMMSRRRAKKYDWEGQAVELITGGRNCHVRYGVITQFASMLDKLLIKLTRQRYMGFSNEPNDLDYLEDIIGKEKAQELPNLGVGEFLYSYPRRGHEPTRKIKIPMFSSDATIHDIPCKQ